MKLHIYGDSFVNLNPDLDLHNKQFCWPEEVSKRLGLKSINNAVPGSSVEYSMYKFVNDIENGTIGNDDLIIYVQTTNNRLYFKHFIHKDPIISTSFIGLSKEEIYADPRYTYYQDNYDHLVWYYNNLEEKVNALHHESFLHSIKNYATIHPKVKILLLLLEPMSGLNEIDHFGFLENIPQNLYFPNLSLNSISDGEFTDAWDVRQWSKLVGYDPRVNHLSSPNLKILADLATNTFRENGCIKNWSKDKFLTNIFSRVDTLEKYEYYCNKDMLWCYDVILEKYKSMK